MPADVAESFTQVCAVETCITKAIADTLKLPLGLPICGWRDQVSDRVSADCAGFCHPTLPLLHAVCGAMTLLLGLNPVVASALPLLACLGTLDACTAAVKCPSALLLWPSAATAALTAPSTQGRISGVLRWLCFC